MNTIFFRETEMISDSASSFGSQPPKHSSICQSRSIPLSCLFVCLFITITQLQTFRLAFPNRLALASPVLPGLTQQQVHSPAGQDTLLPGKTLVCGSDGKTFPLFTQNISSCGCVLFVERTKLVGITYFSDFLTTGGWEGDI